MSAAETSALPASESLGRASLARIFTGLTAAAAIAATAAGFFALLDNRGDALAVPVLVLVAILMGANVAYWRLEKGLWDIHCAIVAGAALLGVAILLALPEYLYGYELNGIIHRSLFSSAVLLTVGVSASMIAVTRLFGGTPTAADNGRYPLILLPIALALIAYCALLARLLADGAGDLSWSVISTPYAQHISETGQFTYTAGLRNQILGTLLLIVMTSFISLPPGVGAGIFISQYKGPLVHVVRFSTTMLRAVSVFIIGVAAFSLVDMANGYPVGNPISDLIRGYYTDDNGTAHASHGSFLTASLFLSLLVIPVITRTTEEGFNSIPREIKEGSVALGATDGHGLLRLMLPWAAPNIITGLLIGAAEAAGSVAVIILIAGTGENGVSPLREATSLAFGIFGASYGPSAFQEHMAPYKYASAIILLVITLGLTISALVIRQRFAARYRGSLTSD